MKFTYIVKPEHIGTIFVILLLIGGGIWVVWLVGSDISQSFEEAKTLENHIEMCEQDNGKDSCPYYKCALQGMDIDSNPTKWRNYNDAYQTCLLEEK